MCKTFIYVYSHSWLEQCMICLQQLAQLRMQLAKKGYQMYNRFNCWLICLCKSSPIEAPSFRWIFWFDEGNSDNCMNKTLHLIVISRSLNANPTGHLDTHHFFRIYIQQFFPSREKSFHRSEISFLCYSVVY